MSLRIRTAVPAEMPALIDLWVEAWTAFLPEIDFEGRRAWFLTYLADLQRDGADLLVAEGVERGALGFVTVDRTKQDMDQLVTARAAQRRGVGRALVRAAKQHSPMALGLSVLQTNQPAIALYEQEGFVVTGRGIGASSGRPTFHMRWQSRGL